MKLNETVLNYKMILPTLQCVLCTDKVKSKTVYWLAHITIQLLTAGCVSKN